MSLLIETDMSDALTYGITDAFEVICYSNHFETSTQLLSTVITAVSIAYQPIIFHPHFGASGNSNAKVCAVQPGIF